MKVYDEISLSDFKPWSGAVNKFNSLSYSELNTVEAIIEELYPDGISASGINDLFWFDFDTICEWLGIKTESEIESEIAEKQEEIDSLMEDYEMEVDEDDTEEDRIDYYNKRYKDDIDDLKEEIEELNEELARWR